MKKPTWVVFDVGDVLLNWQTSSAALASHLGVDKNKLLDTLFNYADDMFIGKIGPEEGWSLILSDLGVKADPWEMILKWRDKSAWFQETLAVIPELNKAGYKLAIMSNSWLCLSDARDANLLPEELKMFVHIFDSSQLGVKKPDIKFYNLVEDGLGSKNDDIILIDDSLSNKVPAEKKGWHFFNYITKDNQAKNSAERLIDTLIK